MRSSLRVMGQVELWSVIHSMIASRSKLSPYLVIIGRRMISVVIGHKNSSGTSCRALEVNIVSLESWVVDDLVLVGSLGARQSGERERRR
jgi:hypothetical protein